jgi:hypothetical protein
VYIIDESRLGEERVFDDGSVGKYVGSWDWPDSVEGEDV